MCSSLGYWKDCTITHWFRRTCLEGSFISACFIILYCIAFDCVVAHTFVWLVYDPAGWRRTLPLCSKKIRQNNKSQLTTALFPYFGDVSFSSPNTISKEVVTCRQYLMSVHHYLALALSDGSSFCQQIS